MRKLRKLIFILVLVPAALYGIVKGYTWWTIKSQMESLQSAMAPVAAISWQEIATPLMGPIGVKNIVVRPNIVNDPIQIGSVLIHANGPMERFELLRAHIQDEVPKNLKLSINRVSLDLNGEIAKWLGALQTGATVGTQIDALACGNRKFFSVNDLREMGYKELATDVRLEYKFDESKNALSLFAQVRTYDMMVLSIDATIPGTDVPRKIKSVSLQEPSIESLSITVQDLGFNKNKNNFCSVESGRPVEQYLKAHVESVRARAGEIHFRPSEELLTAYRTYLSKPSSTITISINPQDANPLSALSMPDSNDALQALGLEVSLDQKPIKNLGNFKTAAERLAEMQAAQEANKVKVITYRDTPVPDLNKYIDQRVLLNTNDGKFLVGYLTTVSPEEIVITRQMVGGSAVMTIAASNIARARVLREE